MKTKITITMIDGEKTEVTPHIYLPLSEAAPLFGYVGQEIKHLYPDDSQICLMEQRGSQFVCALSTNTTVLLPPETMVYAILPDDQYERNALKKKQALIAQLTTQFGIKNNQEANDVQLRK